MTASTHFAFSYLLCSTAGVDPSTSLIASSCSLLPDIDHPESLIGRIFLPVSKYIQKKYGHRTVTHSVFAILFILVLFSPILIFSKNLYLACSIAFSSHIFIDLFNKSGVRLFAPISQKEYISFRTPELRILVSSWKEYVLLFFIVFMAFSVSGEAFSISKSARMVGRLIYKNYDSAIREYQDCGTNLCYAEVEYYDQALRSKLSERLPVLNMSQEKAYFLKNNERLSLSKENINEILIDKSETKVDLKKLSGSDPSLLKTIPGNAYISGIVKVKNFIPKISNNEFLTVEHSAEGATIHLQCAKVSEILPLINISESANIEIDNLERKLSSYQIAVLKAEDVNLKSQMNKLKDSGLYANYGTASKLSGELKKVQSRISALEMKESIGADNEYEKEIERIKGFSVSFELSFLMW